MRKLIKLKKDISIVFNTQITEFLNPDTIYLPIKANYKALVKPGDSILKGQIILENNLNKIISPVSGVVGNLKKMTTENGVEKCLVISNDFKEQTKLEIVKE
jgi:Na+-translocating ferredoxin:NAD+ oxidoreductase RnfC subunit